MGFFMKVSYRKYFTKVALIWGGCFVLFFLIHILVMGPQKKSKKQVEEQLAEKKRLYDSALEATREETKLRLNEQIEHLRNKLRDFVLEDLGNLTFDISQIAGEKKINPPPTIKGKNKSKSSAKPKYDYISEEQININFTASFNQFATFLNRLERHRPVVFIDRFTITRSRQGNSDHKVDMDLAVFVRKRQDS